MRSESKAKNLHGSGRTYVHTDAQDPADAEVEPDASLAHQDAIWKKTYVDSLPDSHFMHVVPGGVTDGTHTSPRELRHFPFKDHTGTVDQLHVRHAIGTVHESGLPTNVKAKVHAKLEAMLTQSRNDTVRLDASKFTRTPQGGLRGPAAVTKVGVFRYRHKDGRIVNEYRPADEVFAQESLATLEQAPITDGHVAMVDTGNYTTLAKGQITAINHDQTHVLATAVIQDATLANNVLAGKRVDLSCGYVCKFDWTPGTYNGQAYDVVQRDIHYNHVALLPRGTGRQGTDVALRFDAGIVERMIIHLDGTDYDLSDDAQRKAYHDAMQAKIAAATAATDKALARADAVTAELVPLRAAQDAAARTALETRVRKVMGAKAPATFTGTDRQIRELAIGGDLTGKSDDYVAARFDALEEAPVTDPALAAALAALQTPEGTLPPEAPPPAWTQRWKEPLTASKDK